MSTRQEVLKTAASLVDGDRAKDYGDATESFTRLGMMWTAILGQPVTAAQVAMCLAALKLSRLSQTPNHRDSWVDLAGYAALGAEVSGS
jgi:hypothetical protein